MSARLISLFTALFLLGNAMSAQAAPAPELIEKWTAHNASSTERVDHGPWEEFLFRHMRPGSDGITRVDYGCVQPSEHASLKGYIRGLTRVQVSTLNKTEQFAYWVNLYNALTVDLVLDHYPIASIRDIQFATGITGFFSNLINAGPWDEPLLKIEGSTLSLNNIEHGILRPIWKDPKIHFALNCASLGCPNLQGAYTAQNSRTLLHKGAWDYVNHPRGTRTEAGGVMVSDLFVWYQDDFAIGGSAAADQGQGMVKFLKTYAKPGTADALTSAMNSSTPLQGMGYDWRLNDAACGAY